MNGTGHKSTPQDHTISLSDYWFKFEANGSFYRPFAFKLIRTHLRNVMKVHRDDTESADESSTTDADSNGDEDVARPAVFAPFNPGFSRFL